MATQTRATADAVLKDLYVEPIVRLLNDKTYLLDQIERDAESVDHTGRRAVFPVVRNRNRGRGSRPDAGTLPVAGYQDTTFATVPIRYHYMGIEVSDAVIEASKSDVGAFTNVLNMEIQGAATDMKRDLNRQCFGFGTGELATVAAAATSGSTTVTVDNGQYITIGDVIDIRDPSTGAARVANATVVGVTPASGAQVTLTLDTALTANATTTDKVYIAGNRNNEMDGLGNMTNANRVLHGIDSSVAANSVVWNPAARLDAGNAVAGEDLFIRLADAVGRISGAQVDLFLTTRGVRRRLANTYQSQKRFSDAKAVEVHGGYTAIWVNEIPVLVDDDCQMGRVYAITKDALRWFEQTKPGWLEQKDGSVFHLKQSAQPGQRDAVWQAWFRWYAAFAAKAPNRLGVIFNAQDDVYYARP